MFNLHQPLPCLFSPRSVLRRCRRAPRHHRHDGGKDQYEHELNVDRGESQPLCVPHQNRRICCDELRCPRHYESQTPAVELQLTCFVEVAPKLAFEETLSNQSADPQSATKAHNMDESLLTASSDEYPLGNCELGCRIV